MGSAHKLVRLPGAEGGSHCVQLDAAVCETRENSVGSRSAKFAVGFRTFFLHDSYLQKELLVVLLSKLEMNGWRVEHGPGLTFREIL